MPAERKARLDALGFVWDPYPEQWETGYRRLQEFVREHGHCRVPATYLTADGYQLGPWANTQRAAEDRMPADRKERLDAHGFVWGVLAAQWEKGFKQLQTFGRENGHCRVPAKYVTAEGYRLGQWVSVQRVGKDSMPAERKARLDALGFVWTSKVNERRPAAE